MKSIIRRRCDKPMRRSKEQGYVSEGIPWRCTGECQDCFCCIYTTDDGKDRHVNLTRKNPEGVDEW